MRSGITLSNQKLNPAIDKYEVTLFGTIFLIFTIYYIIQYFRVPLDFSLLTTIIIIVAIALLLISITYHIDRESEWKKKQQSQTHTTLQNCSLMLNC